jgi:hypothetical protein
MQHEMASYILDPASYDVSGHNIAIFDLNRKTSMLMGLIHALNQNANFAGRLFRKEFVLLNPFRGDPLVDPFGQHGPPVSRTLQRFPG